MHNPYLDEYKQLPNEDPVEERARLVLKYSWAVPNEEAIDYLCSNGPLVEIGAGGGYWANLITQEGGDIIAYDKEPYDNRWVKCRWFDDISIGGPMTLRDHGDRTLFLCWPLPWVSYRCLKNFKGDDLVFIGEFNECCGTDAFFWYLHFNWRVEHTIDIPQFEGMNDYIVHFKRKTKEDYIYHKEW